MAKHHQPKQRRARKAVIAGAAAAGVSGALVLGLTTDTTAHQPVTLANTIIGVGGRDDPTAARIEDKLAGHPALDFAGTYVPINYPANLLFQSSIDDGVPKLGLAVGAAEGKTRVVAYSEGTLVAEQYKRNIAAAASGSPLPANIDFVLLASPYSPNGGIFSRFTGFQIPGLLPLFGAALPTAYNSTFVTNEYDGFADFPAYFNPLSIANALLGMAYAHPDQYYDGIDLDSPDTIKYVKTIDNNGANGKDTYILVYNPHLPLFAPIRQLAELTGLTAFTEPMLAAIEPLTRLMVDMGYTDRTNATAGTPTPFSFITPQAKIDEALAGVPGAIAQGSADAQSGGQAATTVDVPSPNARQAQSTLAPNQDAKLAAAQAKSSDSEVGTQSESESSGAASSSSSTPAATGSGPHSLGTSRGNKFTPGGTAQAGSSAGGKETETTTPSVTGPSVPDATNTDDTTINKGATTAKTTSSPAASGQAAA